MNDASGGEQSGEDLARLMRIMEVCRQFEIAWRSDPRRRIEEALERLPPGDRAAALHDLIPLEYELRHEAGEHLDTEEFRGRFPDQQSLIDEMLAERPSEPAPTTGPLAHAPDEDGFELAEGFEQVPHDERPRDERPRDEQAPRDEPPRDEPAAGGPPGATGGSPQPPRMPLRLGDYEFVQLLGEGTFGLVGKYYCTGTRRNVAIKIPRRQSPEELDRFFTEAKGLAALDAEGVVPIYYVDRRHDPPYLVMPFMRGGELSNVSRDHPASWDRIAEVVALAAEALDGIHGRGYVHRDLKPPNILLDARGRPHIADCGLMMHVGIRQQLRGEFAGSRPYMSPEQLRCEELDARSDLWSLGVILYELLTGRRPFDDEAGFRTRAALHDDPPRPRRLKPRIPDELERICLRLLEKRPDDRYASAAEVARDLRSWREAQHAPDEASPGPIVLRPTLASLDEHHAGGFLSLLPGPRERDGVPAGLHFWRSRIESADSDRAFRVGVLYGKSGCGKSSLLRAGLLPRLAPHVAWRLIEATPDDTEVRLLKSLRKLYPQLTDELDLAQSLALLREELIPRDGKLLLVVDQFEQWLHAWNGRSDDQLPAALRHCDGVRLQCLLSVRDDFWLSLTRLMREVGVRLREHENTVAVDLFDRRHARTVLRSYGQSLGAIDPHPTPPQEQFLEAAVERLSEDQGRIVCVRLVMLAQMMAGRDWVPETLEELGGLDELGVKFLDELIRGDSAPPQRRLHARALDGVLGQLVPQRGSDIKQRMQSRRQLQAACPKAYRRDERLFEEALQILESELRLITPTEPDVAWAGELDESASTGADDPTAQVSERHYQLTHDYLVVPLRERRWRTDRQTLRGRARWRLQELATLWDSRRTRQFLPRWWEDLFLRVFTRSKSWSDDERRMMRRSGRTHGVRALGVLGFLVLLIWLGQTTFQRSVARLRWNAALHSELSELDAALRELEPHAARVRDPLQDALANPSAGTYRNALLARVILDGADQGGEAAAGDEAGGDARLRDLLLKSPLEELRKIIQLLRARAPHVLDRVQPEFWSVLESPSESASRRVRAACVLAGAVGEPMSGLPHRDWQGDKQEDGQGQAERLASEAARELVRNPADLDDLAEMLQPLADFLNRPLARLARTTDPDPAQADRALDLLRVLARDDPQLLVETAVQLNPTRRARTLAVDFEARPDDVTAWLRRFAAGEDGEDLERSSPATELARLQRQATAAAFLARLGQPEEAWNRLKHDPRPTLRGLLIESLPAVGVAPELLVAGFRSGEQEDRRQGLLLALGTYPPPVPAADGTWPEPWNEFLKATRGILADDAASATLRGGAEWLLRAWRLMPPAAPSHPVDLSAPLPLRHLARIAGPEGHELVVLDGRTFTMGSPESEPERRDNERQHRRDIGRWFAIATKEVTVAQYATFVRAEFGERVEQEFLRSVVAISPDAACPVPNVRWFDAARYCNWLTEKAKLVPFYVPMAAPAGQAATSLRPDPPDGPTFRLPTEAEWEFAARAGTLSAYSFGDAPHLLELHGWYLFNARERTWPVGTRMPNDFGLFDLHGNVSEWCHEAYSGYPRPEAESSAADPVDTDPVTDRTDRVRRGGAFSLYARHARCASRDRGRPSQALPPMGFRVVLAFPPGR